ncbi:MAG: signal peptidase II, partial [Chromatiales bacterium]
MMRYLWLSLAIILLDQVTKLWIDSSFTLHERVPVIPGFFDLMLAYNEGAAFSFLADQDGWQRWFFTGLTLVISIVL